MAEKAKPTGKLTKVIASYGVREDSATLWGVDFVKEGDGEEAVYVAHVEEEIAKSLIESNRARKAE